MRKTVGAALVLAIMVAVVGAVVGLWLPARHDAQARAAAADRKALAAVSLPSAYRIFGATPGRNQVCTTNETERCFVVAGDPSDNTTALRRALASMADGAITSSCEGSSELPNSAPSCLVQVPVPGGRLAANLFARAVTEGADLSSWTHRGTYVFLHADS